MSPEDEALYGRICEMQARGAFMLDITAALGVTKEEVRRVCAAYREEAHITAAAQRERFGQTAERARVEEVESAYVDLHEAIGVVVRRMPDGVILAATMTDGWIGGGGRLLHDSDKNDAQMIGTYGPDWRTVRPRVSETFRRADHILEKVLASGRVDGFGVSVAAPERGQRPIEPHEWASRRLDARHGLLATPPGKRFDTHPPIRDVLVSVKDLKRECGAMITSEVSAPPDLESMLRELRHENPNLTRTAAEEIAPNRGAIEKREEIRRMWKRVGGSSTPGPKGPRKNRAVPPA
jgi:hypothetical protein